MLHGFSEGSVSAAEQAMALLHKAMQRLCLSGFKQLLDKVLRGNYLANLEEMGSQN